MHVMAVDAPTGPMEPAPITSLCIHMDCRDDQLSAFWTADDAYYVRATGAAGERWFRVDVGPAAVPSLSEEERLSLGALLADVIPMGGGRVPFPFGSTGRRVYRVWCSARGANGKTRVLGARAARSRRLPA